MLSTDSRCPAAPRYALSVPDIQTSGIARALGAHGRIQTDRDTQTQTDRDTQTQTDTQRHTDTDADTDAYADTLIRRHAESER
eukprot:557623-Rhodomonas_salina.1